MKCSQTDQLSRSRNDASGTHIFLNTFCCFLIALVPSTLTSSPSTVKARRIRAHF
jgi:hypothetical protein